VILFSHSGSLKVNCFIVASFYSCWSTCFSLYHFSQIFQFSLNIYYLPSRTTSLIIIFIFFLHAVLFPLQFSVYFYIIIYIKNTFFTSKILAFDALFPLPNVIRFARSCRSCRSYLCCFPSVSVSSYFFLYYSQLISLLNELGHH